LPLHGTRSHSTLRLVPLEISSAQLMCSCFTVKEKQEAVLLRWGKFERQVSDPGTHSPPLSLLSPLAFFLTSRQDAIGATAGVARFA
jgi:regulator of protease activity HflC (stomatin/prohibitin superfamily)